MMRETSVCLIIQPFFSSPELQHLQSSHSRRGDGSRRGFSGRPAPGQEKELRWSPEERRPVRKVPPRPDCFHCRYLGRRRRRSYSAARIPRILYSVYIFRFGSLRSVQRKRSPRRRNTMYRHGVRPAPSAGSRLFGSRRAVTHDIGTKGTRRSPQTHVGSNDDVNTHRATWDEVGHYQPVVWFNRTHAPCSKGQRSIL